MKNQKKQNILIVHNYYQIPGGEDTVVAKDLAYGIQLCSSNKKILSPSCREKVCKEFSSERIGRLYKEFYLQER